MANEKRLIDAYALIEDIKKRYCEPCKAAGDDYCEVACRACWVDDVILEIDPAPAVDAVEVVHGHWIVLHFMTEPWQLSLHDKYVCSECKKITWSRHNYCPNCGAKMDGDGYEG